MFCACVYGWTRLRPKKWFGFFKGFAGHLTKTTGSIATVCGRYYAMDRDKRWERVKLAYDAIVNGIGVQSSGRYSAIENSYNNNVTDEFIKPVVITDKAHRPIGSIS
jgi:2,3-bisphosphoglycerate-independent phosphoglycerate mutase